MSSFMVIITVVMGIIKIIIMVIVTVIMVITYCKKRYMVNLTSSRWFKKCSLSTAMFRLPNSLVKSFWFKTESCISCMCHLAPYSQYSSDKLIYDNKLCTF